MNTCRKECVCVCVCVGGGGGGGGGEAIFHQADNECIVV